MRSHGVLGFFGLLTLANMGCQGTLPVQPHRPLRVETATPAEAEETSDFLPAINGRQTAASDVVLASAEIEVPPEAADSHADPKTLGSGDPISLLDLEAIAFESNPTLSAATARIQAAHGKQVQAGLYPNPVVGYDGTQIGNLGTAGQQGGFISQRFITGGKRKLDQMIAGKEVDEFHFQFHADEQRVLSDVRVRFYEALVAQRRIELAKELTEIGDNLVDTTKTLYEARQGTENDLLQAEIRADESNILLDNARNQNVEAWTRLAAVIGRPDLQVQPLDGTLEAELPEYGWDECYELALSHNPAVNAARTRVDRMNVAIARAQRQPIPNVDLLVSVRHSNFTDSDVANVQLGIPVPIFDKNQGNVQRAEAEWIAASNEVRRLELDLLDRLAVTYRRYQNARQQVDRYNQRMLPRAKRSLDLVTRAYENGQIEYLMLLTAQETYVRVNLSYLESLQELWAAISIIEGQLLTGSLGNNGGAPR